MRPYIWRIYIRRNRTKKVDEVVEKVSYEGYWVFRGEMGAEWGFERIEEGCKHCYNPTKEC